ncbi:hypothetical protein OG241_27260 [Streptomyces sp. NBC_01390]|uniref:hypothetical protein n=1 Tax=Streptomyces sp. NBC_01390 TaxID=2903850 RepID=UPI0032529743
MQDLASLVEPLRSLDWEDVDAVEAASRKLLERLDEAPGIVRRAPDELPDRPELLALCEHPDAEVAAGSVSSWTRSCCTPTRSRGYASGRTPSGRAATTSSTTTAGPSRASCSRGPSGTPCSGSRRRDAAGGAPGAARTAGTRGGRLRPAPPDAARALAEPGTVSLVVRGPAAKDRSFLVDTATGERLWHYGVDRESAEEAARKRMTPAHRRSLIEKFDAAGLFARPRP